MNFLTEKYMSNLFCVQGKKGEHQPFRKQNCEYFQATIATKVTNCYDRLADIVILHPPLTNSVQG
jgi:hypothetical protein